MPETNEGVTRMKPADTLPPEEMAYPDDAYCSITNRIVVISPLPQKIHELIRGLTAACYDVMVFHRGDSALPGRLQADYLIADCTRSADGPDGYAWLDSSELGEITVIRLVSDLSSAAGKGNLLTWPVPLPEALAFVRSLSKAGLQPMADPADTFPASADPSSTPLPVQAEGILRLQDLSLDLKRHSAALGGIRLDLTKTEFELLRVLLEAEGAVMSRQELLDKVWGDDYYAGSNTVDVHVKTLRQKLNDDPKAPRYIVTVRGIGYRAAVG